jgi:hypothetical protein
LIPLKTEIGIQQTQVCVCVEPLHFA